MLQKCKLREGRLQFHYTEYTENILQLKEHLTTEGSATSLSRDYFQALGTRLGTLNSKLKCFDNFVIRVIKNAVTITGTEFGPLTSIITFTKLKQS